jgi:hypothetical protein
MMMAVPLMVVVTIGLKFFLTVFARSVTTKQSTLGIIEWIAASAVPPRKDVKAHALNTPPVFLTTSATSFWAKVSISASVKVLSLG